MYSGHSRRTGSWSCLNCPRESNHPRPCLPSSYARLEDFWRSRKHYWLASRLTRASEYSLFLADDCWNYPPTMQECMLRSFWLVTALVMSTLPMGLARSGEIGFLED